MIAEEVVTDEGAEAVMKEVIGPDEVGIMKVGEFNGVNVMREVGAEQTVVLEDGGAPDALSERGI